ncbi:MAG: branched-chain amino acid ABC transporter permease [Chloroflexi bacterium]|nr:branched-chain amino acid ABC transporter permease [Chloroflexota bacterium]
MSTRRRAAAGLAISVGIAAGLILLGDAYLMRIATLGAIFAILALGLNLTAGHLGLFDFGYVLYFGIGGYATALLTLRAGWAWEAALLASVVISVAAGVVVGVVVLRLRGPYFVIATFSFLTVAYYVAINWRDVTNGSLGLIGLPAPAIELPFLGRVDGFSPSGALAIAVTGLLVAVGVVWRVVASGAGRAWHAIRDNEDLASSVGLDPARYAFLALGISAGLGGLGGSLYAGYVGIVTPEIFSFGHMVNVLLMVVIGGTGTFLGPLVGAFLVESVPELLRVAEAFRLPIFGIMLIAAILFAPRGVVSLRRPRRTRPGRQLGSSVTGDPS